MSRTITQQRKLKVAIILTVLIVMIFGKEYLGEEKL
jgi:hypothetical protein